MKPLFLGALIASLLCQGAMAALNDPAGTYQDLVDQQGEIHFPVDFQTELVHLGTTVVMAEDMKPANLNGIYTQQKAINHYNQTGEWLDGTVFVKDVKFVPTERLTTGLVGHQEGNDIFFVMVKDNQQRFSGHENWGDGWGWAMYGAKPTMNESPNKEFCQGCHMPRKDNQWLYTDQYPALLKR
ncbi:cytochrome P460 family protein [Motilimonas pumila]|uniref:Cytochrome C n=1 Tax=Motilimonas pumila TaxID=2303987 RepID=A0A418YIM4_9GAMM|nr:cytochrome P460 family protein [Motilimonas pumila]RJG50501.1 cytochrome C [Motilimonas pumila]